MPIGVADIVLVRKQLLEKLHAIDVNNRYTDAIGTDSEFLVLAELSDFILLTDEEICLDIIKTPGHGWRSHFLVQSGALNSGDYVPDHVGVLGDRVMVSTGAGYTQSQQAENRDEILAMIKFPGLYPSREYHWLQDGVILSPATTIKVWYPMFTRGSTCQAPQTAESALLYGAIEKAEKINSEPQFFSKYSSLYQLSRGYVREEQPIPPQEILEKQLEARS